ncbi:hypothetical protein F5Y04DRAFT_282824 [Hypomontagnella monticulosa]|nr:hypothetical protein F5Y04DRAFT_282824 [Hypomontagnella monticulosa]
MESNTKPNETRRSETDDPPPAYDDSSNHNNPGGTTEPPPTSAKSLYFQNPVAPHLSMSFGPSNTQDINSMPWMGLLHVKCDDMAQLMRDGFHWTTQNVQREDGYYGTTSACTDHNPNDKEWLLHCGFYETRHYFLRDLQHNPPRWVANFKFHAREREILTRIRLEYLTVERIFRAKAFGDACETIYEFRRYQPERNFNAIYDDMPLDGWWPWPKKKRLIQEEETLDCLGWLGLMPLGSLATLALSLRSWITGE